VLQHPALHVSLTATASVVAVAVSRAGPVGVDAEQVDRAAFAGFSSVALGPGEHTADAVAAARAWARKEAVLKATGYGLALDPREVDVSRSAVSWPVPATVVDVPSPAGTACAAALLGPGRVELELGECSLP
jgi:4'-phosphopantetheinyl transferase